MKCFMCPEREPPTLAEVKEVLIAVTNMPEYIKALSVPEALKSICADLWAGLLHADHVQDAVIRHQYVHLHVTGYLWVK